MATFGHFATGLVGGRIAAVKADKARLVQLGFGVLALAPDVDSLIPGLRHDGPTSRTHTPAASFLGSTLASLAAPLFGLPRRRTFVSALIALGSQSVLDAMTHGQGEAVAWPASRTRYFARVPGLPTWKPEKRGSSSGFRSFAGELAWSLPLFIIAALPLRSRPARDQAETRAGKLDGRIGALG